MQLLNKAKTVDLSEIDVPNNKRFKLWVESNLCDSQDFTAAELAEFASLELEDTFAKQVIDKVRGCSRELHPVEKIKHVRQFCLEAAGLGLPVPSVIRSLQILVINTLRNNNSDETILAFLQQWALAKAGCTEAEANSLLKPRAKELIADK
jgi:hypothetical protein